MQTDLWFELDRLSMLMMGLIFSIGVCVLSFSRRYLDGDVHRKRFFVHVILFITSLLLTFASQHVGIFLFFWLSSNVLLTRLMQHQAHWKAAVASAKLARYTLVGGWLLLAMGLGMLSYASGSLFWHDVVHASYHPSVLWCASFCFLGAVAIQSGLFPFQGWLLSSLNSPTPVSALMHAGLVNGSGFLLIKLSPLYAQIPYFLNALFVLGLVSVILGSIFKLLQNNVKRMLACSTMAQMGFMIVQCSLGLFASAMVHLMCHSFFKANLFLNAGAAAQEKKIKMLMHHTWPARVFACVNGVLGAFVFAAMIDMRFHILDTHAFIVGLVGVASMHIALNYLDTVSFKNMLYSVIASLIFSACYGFVVHAVEVFLHPLQLMPPLVFSSLHAIGLLLLMFMWLGFLLSNIFQSQMYATRMYQKFYVLMQRLSRPHTKTLTTYRNDYSSI